MRNLVGAYCGVVAKWRCGDQNMPNLTADDEITAHRAENYGKLVTKLRLVEIHRFCAENRPNWGLEIWWRMKKVVSLHCQKI